MHAAVIESPLGKLGIDITAGRVSGIDFLSPGARLKMPDDAIQGGASKKVSRPIQTKGALFDQMDKLSGGLDETVGVHFARGRGAAGSINNR